MILIADSGSTQTTWNLVGKDRDFTSYHTSGINPFFLGKDEIISLLDKEFAVQPNSLSSIYFYGAGCALPEKKQILKEALQTHFRIDAIEIHSDLLAAARSLCQDQPGIACILGTGSNSCFYDGKEIVSNISPLGYILGDEGSGAVMGRYLLSDILKTQLPESLREDFFHTYHITAGEILENVYRKPFPNRFMAQFTRFISKHIGQPEINNLVNRCFREFFQRNILQYKEAKIYPLQFTGSVAAVFSKNLEETAAAFGLEIGKISPSPMEGLRHYHLHQI